MKVYANNISDNSNIAAFSKPGSTITIGTDATSYTLAIPCYGHDGSVGIEIDSASGIAISNVFAAPFGLYVDIDTTSAVVGTYALKLLSKSRSNDDYTIVLNQMSIDITGVAGFVSYSYGDVDIHPDGSINQILTGGEYGVVSIVPDTNTHTYYLDPASGGGTTNVNLANSSTYPNNVEFRFKKISIGTTNINADAGDSLFFNSLVASFALVAVGESITIHLQNNVWYIH